TAPLALGLVSLLMFQKQIIRPPIAGQLLPVPALGLGMLVAAVLQSRPLALLPRLWTAFCAGLLLSCFTVSVATGRDALRGYVDIVTGVKDDVRYLLFEHDRWLSARERFFDADSFELDGTSGRQLLSQILASVPIRPEDMIFVLGDDPFLY